MTIPADLYPILTRYAAIVSDFVCSHFTPEQIHEYQELLGRPETTYRDAMRLIVEGHGHPEKAFYALEALERIKGLAYAAECPSSETVDADKAFLVAFSALRAGMMVGAIVGEEGKEKSNEMLGLAAEANEQLEAEFRKRSAAKAACSLHRSLNDMKAAAAAVCENLWQTGSTLKHHEMAKYLADEYEEDRRHPFMHLPLSEKQKKDKKDPLPANGVLREVCKEVALKIGRPELIFGLKT